MNYKNQVTEQTLSYKSKLLTAMCQNFKRKLIPGETERRPAREDGGCGPSVSGANPKSGTPGEDRCSALPPSWCTGNTVMNVRGQF